MYTIVIEEIKGQIKVEQELRNSLRKQLSRKQKNEMALIHRRKYTQGSTESIMRSVNDSINKWV